MIVKKLLRSHLWQHEWCQQHFQKKIWALYFVKYPLMPHCFYPKFSYIYGRWQLNELLNVSVNQNYIVLQMHMHFFFHRGHTSLSLVHTRSPRWTTHEKFNGSIHLQDESKFAQTCSDRGKKQINLKLILLLLLIFRG